MIFDPPRDGDLPRMVTVLGMATIIGLMTNDHSWDGGHLWGRVEDFDDFGEGDLPRDGDHHRGGHHPRDSGCVREFYHPDKHGDHSGQYRALEDCNKLNKSKQS